MEIPKPNVVLDLGWCMARLDPSKRTLTIVSPSDSGEPSYSPAESVMIYGADKLQALAKAISADFPAEGPSC